MLWVLTDVPDGLCEAFTGSGSHAGQVHVQVLLQLGDIFLEPPDS